MIHRKRIIHVEENHRIFYMIIDQLISEIKHVLYVNGPFIQIVMILDLFFSNIIHGWQWKTCAIGVLTVNYKLTNIHLIYQ